MRIKRIVSFFFWIVVLKAHAYEVPRHFMSGASGFMSMGFRQSCFSLDIPSDTLPCNPAFIAKEKERRFNANVYLGNNVSYLKEATDLSQGHANEDSIQTIFKRHEDNQLQTQIELGHVQETFGWAVTPMQVNYSTTFRNQALPEISLYASLEESARIQFGSYLSDDWSFGVQLRYLQRRFVASRFFLLEALLPSGKYLFEPRRQSLFFVEPALLYAPKGNSANPEFTLMIANAGWVNQNYAELPVTPEYHFTSSVNPELSYGRFSLGLDLNLNKNMRTGQFPVTLGSFYEYGILRLFGSIGRDENAVGMGVFNAWWNMGVAHRNDSYEDAVGSMYTLNRTYLFIGIEI